MTKVNLETNFEPIVLELDEQKAPGTVRRTSWTT